MIRLLHSLLVMLYLEVRSIFMPGALIDPVGATVSLTTFGRRTKFVHLGLESIRRGRQRPGRVILWVDNSDGVHQPRVPRGTRRYIRRGLEIRSTPDYGPHKKWWPFVALASGDHPMFVTADDDVIYPRYWLAGLLSGASAHPTAVVAHRARRFKFLSHGGSLVKYASWEPASAGSLSIGNISTGFGGILYPARCLLPLFELGTDFMQFAPKADDLWLHRSLVRAGIPTLQLERTKVRDFLEIRGHGSGGLVEENVLAGGNDSVIAELYTAADLSRIQSAVSPDR